MDFRRILKNNSLWAALLVLVKSAIGFFLVPFMTNIVGIEAYGYVSLANTMITYIDIVSISFNYFAQRYISIAYHRGDYQSSNKYYSSIFIADIVLCIFTSIPLGFFIWKLDYFLNINVVFATDVKILFALVLVRYYISLIASTLEIGAFIRDCYATIAKNKIFSCGVQLVLILVLYGYAGKKVYYVGIAALAYDVVNLILQYFFKTKYTSDLVLSYKKYSFSAIRELLSKGIWIAINNVGNILNHGLDLLIANLMISEITMGQISVAKTISSITYSVVSGISEAFKPRQLKMYSLGNTQELIDELKYTMKITGTVFIVMSGIYVSCGRDLLFLWMGNQDVMTIYYLMVICVFSDFIPSLVKPLYYVYTLTTKMRIPCIVTITMGALNVVSMFLLLKYTTYGGYAVVLTTLVINTFHLVDSPLYSAYCLNVCLSTFYNVVAVYCIVFLINSFICWTLIGKIGFSMTWGTLIMKGMVSMLASLVIAVSILFTKDEKKRLLKAVVAMDLY